MLIISILTSQEVDSHVSATTTRDSHALRRQSSCARDAIARRRSVVAHVARLTVLLLTSCQRPQPLKSLRGRPTAGSITCADDGPRWPRRPTTWMISSMTASTQRLLRRPTTSRHRLRMLPSAVGRNPSGIDASSDPALSTSTSAITATTLMITVRRFDIAL